MPQNFDKIFFLNNREKLYKYLKSESVVIINSNDKYLRNGDQFYKYRQNSTLYYFTGIYQENTIAVFCPEHPNKKLREVLFIKEPDINHQIWDGEQLCASKATEISHISNIMWLQDFDITLREILSFANNIYLNSNEYPKLQTDYTDSDNRMALILKELYPLHQYQRLYPLASKLRLIKNEQEIEIIKMGCEMTYESFCETIKHIKPNENEKVIEAQLNYQFAIRHVEPSFHPIVASGKNACVLHYKDNNKAITDGDLLLFDFGLEYHNYATDCSRTLPVNSKFSATQKCLYQAVLNIYKELEKMFVIGNCINNINDEASKLYNKMIVKLNLATEEEIKEQNPENPIYKKYFMHGISHFIGIDVHDVGDKSTPFEIGMVLSCEPGLYIPEKEIGIRLENMLLITDKEPINLTSRIPIEIDDIEKLMAKHNF